MRESLRVNPEDRWQKDDARFEGGQKKNKEEPSRRDFLRGALKGAVGLVATEATLKVTPITFENLNRAASTFERERALEQAIAIKQRNLQDPIVKTALEGGGTRQIETVLNALELPILPEHLEGTRYDASRLHENALQLIFPSDHRGAEIFQVSESGKSSYVKRNVKSGGYGNGVLLENGKFITAEHVACGLRGEEFMLPENGIDMAVMDVWDAQNISSRSGFVEMSDISNDDIHGQFVVVAGIDPDETSDERGHKTYPSVAVKISPGLARAMVGQGAGVSMQREIAEKWFAESFMLILPPGESLNHEGVLDSETSRASGMSGSGVYVFDKGKYKLGGTFWGIVTVQLGNRTMDIGFFHGIDQVRRTIETYESPRHPSVARM